MTHQIIVGYLAVIILLLLCLTLTFGILIHVGRYLRTMDAEVSKITAEDLLDPIPRRTERIEDNQDEDEVGEDPGEQENDAQQESEVNETNSDPV